MLNKMDRDSKGIGFAISVDLLETVDKDTTAYDVDVLVLYDKIDERKLSQTISSYIEKGQSVTAQKAIPERIRYNKLVDLREEGDL